MGKRAKLYGRAYAESLGCLKSDTTEEVGRTKLTNTKKRREFKIQRRKKNITFVPTDFEEASSFARWKTSVKLQRCWQLGGHGWLEIRKYENKRAEN